MADELVVGVLAVLNVASLAAFMGLLGAGLYGMIGRFRLYMQAREPIPILLKRDLILVGSLALIGAEALGIRALGIDLSEPTWLRVAFILQQDVLLLGALAYYVKVELADIDDADVR